jgi:hypothetical protein
MNGDYEFICLPDYNGGIIIIDTLSYETEDTLKSGPFKGKKFQFPVPDTDKRFFKLQAE